jgi:hypothetical protein
MTFGLIHGYRILPGGSNVLNLTPNVAISLLVRGNILCSIFMPFARASEGMRERNRRAGFERGLKGLKVTRTSVRNRVIMVKTSKASQKALCGVQRGCTHRCRAARILGLKG